MFWGCLTGVQALMQPPESLKTAVERVKGHLKGAGTAGDDDDDADVIMVNTVITLKDPLTGTRMAQPARFSDTEGLTAFDLEPFLSMAQRTRKWQDPHSMKNSSVHRLQVGSSYSRLAGGWGTLIPCHGPCSACLDKLHVKLAWLFLGCG